MLRQKTAHSYLKYEQITFHLHRQDSCGNGKKLHLPSNEKEFSISSCPCHLAYLRIFGTGLHFSSKYLLTFLHEFFNYWHYFPYRTPWHLDLISTCDRIGISHSQQLINPAIQSRRQFSLIIFFLTIWYSVQSSNRFDSYMLKI